MMKLLKRHPFPVVADFRKVIALSFSFPEEALTPLLPAGLSLDTFEGFGFVTAALVWTENLRPAGFPKILGRDFFLAGYRIFTKLQTPAGRKLRGLKILRSETDKRSMVFLGNLMTGYNYRRIRTTIEQNETGTRLQTRLPSGTPTLDVSFDDRMPDADLPTGSQFPDCRTARRFAGPMPFTFSSEMEGSFIVVEGSRESWTPTPIAVSHWDIGLFRELAFKDFTPVLANAFVVENVSYRWQRGRRIKP